MIQSRFSLRHRFALKKLSILSIVGGLALLTVSTSASLASTQDPYFSLLDFRATALGVFQSGGNSFSEGASWNPLYHFKDPKYGIRGHFGVGLLKEKDVGNFFMNDTEILFSYVFQPNLRAEIGGGMQFWFRKSATDSALALTVNGIYQFNEKVFNLINAIYLGYTPTLISYATAHEIKFGIELSF